MSAQVHQTHVVMKQTQSVAVMKAQAPSQAVMRHTNDRVLLKRVVGGPPGPSGNPSSLAVGTANYQMLWWDNVAAMWRPGDETKLSWNPTTEMLVAANLTVADYIMPAAKATVNNQALLGQTDGSTAWTALDHNTHLLNVGSNTHAAIDTHIASTIVHVPNGGSDGVLTFWNGGGSAWAATAQDELYWDDTNKRLGIGTTAPLRTMHIDGELLLGVDETYSPGTGGPDNFITMRYNVSGNPELRFFKSGIVDAKMTVESIAGFTFDPGLEMPFLSLKNSTTPYIFFWKYGQYYGNLGANTNGLQWEDGLTGAGRWGSGTVRFRIASGGDVLIGENASSGETPTLDVSGYYAGDALRTVSQGIVAADTYGFTGVSYYSFDGTIKSSEGRIVNTARKTTTATLTIADHTVFGNTDSGAYTITLEPGVEGAVHKITNSGASGNDLTIAADGAELINGSATQTLSDEESIEITYNATDGWRIF